MSLLKFFFTEKCPNCNQRIEKSASFCRHCGVGRGDSWRKCTACGVSVAADSQFCWSCNANLSAQPRDRIFSDRWRRTPGVFATRVTIETPQDRLRNGIQVDDGTRGALFNNGAIKKELGTGYHSQTSFWDRLTGDKKGAFVEAVVAVSDPVSSLVSISDTSDLVTRDHSAVEAALMIKVQLDDLATFTRRMLPTGTDVVRDDDLLLPHTARVMEVIKRHLSSLSVEDVARSVELRHELEAALGEELPKLLADYGLRYRGIEDIRLVSPDIQRIRDAEGDLARAEREQRWEKLKRDMDQAAKLGEIKDEFAFKEQVEQWGHESNLTQLERDHVFKMQAGAREHLQKLQTLRNTNELERIELEGDAANLDIITDFQKKRLALVNEILRDKDERKRRQAEDEVEIERKRIEAYKNAPAHVVAAVLPTEKGNQVIRALEALRPLPEVTIIQSHGLPIPPPSFMPSGYSPSVSGIAAGSNLEQFTQRYIGCVGVVVVGQPGVMLSAIGTAWVVAGRGVVATNAHVAQEILLARDDAGMPAWVIFSGAVSPLPVRTVCIHPDYGHGAAKGHPVPSCDVALIELDGPLPSPGLPLASRQKAFALRELQPAAYLGFPMENLAGGGTSLERPKAIAKRGTISSLEDWMMRHNDSPAQRQLIKHDLGVAGGASGSPMFDEAGDVIGIISAGNMERLYDEKNKSFRRIPNGVMLNFAQRIDVLLDWMGW